MGQNINLLHIYAQEEWHDEAYIIGNRGGLIELKKAITQALKSGRGEAGSGEPGGRSTFIATNDGEGYETIVIMNNTDWLEPFWDKLALPYTEEMASEKRKDAVWPWKIKKVEGAD